MGSGLLSRFDAGLRLTVRPEASTYRPGDTVVVHVEIAADAATEVRSGQIELLCRRRHTYRKREWDRVDDRYETRTKTETEEWRLVDSLLGAEMVPAGDPLYRRIRFRLPADAVPSGEGELMAVEWLVHAWIDVPHRRDVEVAVPLVVLGPEAAATALPEFPAEGTEDEARLTLALASRSVAAGGSLAGTLAVAALRDFSVRSVRIELIRHEETLTALGARAEAVTAVQEIATESDFFSGQRRALPFALPVPAGVPPTHQTEEGRVDWTVRAVLDRSLRGDLAVEFAVNIYGGPSEQG